MKKRWLRVLHGSWLLCAVVLSAGCSTSGIMVSISPQATAVRTGQRMQFNATTNDASGVTWTASAGMIDGNGNYTAPSGAQSTTVMVTATSKTDTSKTAMAKVNVVAPGRVEATPNVQVARYTIAPAGAANVSVQFGLDSSYGLTTWAQAAPPEGGAVSLLVAGMKANTLYHMRAVVQFSDGTQFLDADQTFTTQSLPAAQLPVITVTTTPGMNPQAGVEMLDLIGPPTVAPVAVTDVSGNVLWSYNPEFPPDLLANPIKLMPNGHFLINFSRVVPDGGNSILQ